MTLSLGNATWSYTPTPTTIKSPGGYIRQPPTHAELSVPSTFTVVLTTPSNLVIPSTVANSSATRLSPLDGLPGVSSWDLPPNCEVLDIRMVVTSPIVNSAYSLGPPINDIQISLGDAKSPSAYTQPIAIGDTTLPKIDVKVSMTANTANARYTTGPSGSKMFFCTSQVVPSYGQIDSGQLIVIVLLRDLN